MTRTIMPTHRATILRQGTGSTDYDTDPVEADADTVVADHPVRYHPEGYLRRGPLGEMADPTPTIVGGPELAEEVLEGDWVSLVPIDDSQRTYDDLEVASIEPIYRRRSRPVRTVIELGGA